MLWPSGGLRLLTDKKQEDLLDLITALVKFKCIFSTTVDSLRIKTNCIIAPSLLAFVKSMPMNDTKK